MAIFKKLSIRFRAYFLQIFHFLVHFHEKKLILGMGARCFWSKNSKQMTQNSSWAAWLLGKKTNKKLSIYQSSDFCDIFLRSDAQIWSNWKKWQKGRSGMCTPLIFPKFSSVFFCEKRAWKHRDFHFDFFRKYYKLTFFTNTAKNTNINKKNIEALK